MSNYPITPWTLSSNPALNKYQYGAQGLATGNALIDPLLMMMMGPNMAPRPNPAANSMLSAALMRRRSLDYMSMDRFGLTNNAFTNSFGGINPNSAMGMAMWTANGMTGGTQNGLISRGLSTILGGNPILAQQKLYAGLNGLTTNAAFGLRGEASLHQTSQMMDALSSRFHNAPIKMSAAELSKTGAEIQSKFDKLGLSGDLKKNIEKALSDALKGQTVTAAVDGLTKGLGADIAKEISAGITKASYAAKHGRYGGINFANTYGLSMEDFTGGFTTAASLGLLSYQRGTSMHAAMQAFADKDGAGAVMNASRIMFGGESGSEYMQNLNQFLGVSRVNFANKADVSAVTKALFSMQATALNAGLDPAVMGQLVEQYKGLAQQGPAGMSIGGLEATHGVNRAINKVQSMLLNGGPGMSDYLRRRGGTGGLINSAIQGEQALQSGSPARFLYSMLGAAETQGNAGLVDTIRKYIASGDHSYSGFQDLQRTFSAATGTPMGMMPGLMRDERYNARGMKMASLDTSLDAGSVSAGINMSTIEQHVRQLARGNEGMISDYWDALKNSTNMDDFKDNLERRWSARTGKFGLTSEKGFATLLSQVEPMSAQIFSRYNPKVAASAAANEQFTKMTAAYSADLEGRFGALRDTPVAQLVKMLATGNISQAGIKGVIQGFSGSVKDTDVFRAVQALSEGKEGEFYGYAGMASKSQALTDLGSRSKVIDQIEKFSGKTIDELRKSKEAPELVAYYDEYYGKDSEKDFYNNVFSGGKVSMQALQTYSRKRVAEQMGMVGVKGSKEYQDIIAANNAHLAQYSSIMSPDMLKSAQELGVIVDGKLDSEKLIEMFRAGKLEGGVWSNSPISSITKNMASSIDSILNPESAGGTSADATSLLTKAITDEGGLISVIKALSKALNDLPKQ